MSPDHNGMEPRVSRPGEDNAFDALRAELASVSVSPDFSKRVLTTLNAESAGTLESELNAIAVSPAFAVRVRAAIEQDAARPRWFQAPAWWRWVVPAGVAAGAIVVVTVLMSRQAAQPVVVATSTSPAPVPSPGQTIDIRETPQAPATIAPARTVRPVRVQAVTVVEPAAYDPFLEVITDQPAVLRKMWANAQAPRLESRSAVPVEPGVIVVAPIEVNPIVVKWLGETEAPPVGSSPIIRKVSADAAERSAK